VAADPIDLRILEALQRRFREAIRVSRDFHFEPKASSVSLDPQEILLIPDTELPFYLLQPEPEGEVKYYPAYQKREVMSVSVTARVDVPDGSVPNAKLRAFKKLEADIERAICDEDPSLSEPGVGLGGLCVDIRMRTARAFVGLGSDPIVICQVVLDIPFHGRYGLPASQS
jgi:hypothetical protein